MINIKTNYGLAIRFLFLFLYIGGMYGLGRLSRYLDNRVTDKTYSCRHQYAGGASCVSSDRSRPATSARYAPVKTSCSLNASRVSLTAMGEPVLLNDAAIARLLTAYAVGKYNDPVISPR